MSDDEEDPFDVEDSDDDDEEEASSKKRKKDSSGGKPSKKSRSSLIDDAAEHSGEEEDDDDDEEEDDDDENNDYVRDDFVVDEIEEAEKDDLEDSDDDDSDDDDDSTARRRRRKKKKSRIRKKRAMDELAEDDLDLINEAQGVKRNAAEEARLLREEKQRARLVAKNEAELRKGLFYEDETEEGIRKLPPKKAAVERYDEDGLDDFIDDDIGDQDDIRASERRNDLGGERGGVSEAQLTEASEIFGTDYLDFMAGDEQGQEDEDDLGLGKKFKERGVGVNYGVDSDEDIISDDEDDEDLFGDNDDEGEDTSGLTSRQRAEALKLKREKRELLKKERRKQARQQKSERRKARLRRAFEPVQLVENFCTEQDDEIRMRDAPERFYGWTTPFHGPPPEVKEISEEEEEESMWITGRIPEIASEFFSPPPSLQPGQDATTAMEERQRSVLDSIVHALRFMHREKLEPDFIQRYRADVVTSPAVRDSLYAIMDEDGEWDRMINARSKVENILQGITAAAEGDEAKGADEENVLKLTEELQKAQERLDESLKEEERIKEELTGLGDVEEGDDDEDEDDELFGKDDDDDDAAMKAKRGQKTSLESHLKTIQSLLQERAERVAQLASALKAAEARNNESLQSQVPAQLMTKKMCRSQLWNTGDYAQYLSGLTDARHIIDMNGYLGLIKEGNDAIRKKDNPLDGSTEAEAHRKRSRRFDRDFYRTCVSEGLRSICYKFVLAPYRVGIKLEDSFNNGGFNYDRTLPGDEDEVEGGGGDPRLWVAPVISDTDPTKFASDLVGSGELVLLSSTQGSTADLEDHPELKDPLRGCRYVAAMELAYEPRIRRHLRSIYREKAVLTTRPTAKGMDNIDAFHDFYGLHLIHNKPVKEHFPMDERESETRKAGLGIEERKELDVEMRKREKNSCLQYLNVLKAEQSGDVAVQVHLPVLQEDDDLWYKQDKEVWQNLENQDLGPLMEELEKAYLPPDGDTDEWNQERRKILRFALTNFLLPQFEAETRRELREAAIKVGVVAAADNLKEMAMEGPYRPASMASANRFLEATGDLPIVGICCGSDGKDATYLASVTERGESNDYLAIPSGTRVDDDKMREKVITFLMTNRPAAVVVGTGGGLQSRMLSRKMGELVIQATERWNRRDIQGEDEDDEEFEARQAAFAHMRPAYEDEDDDVPWKCNVDLVNDNVAQLFGRSVRGKKEFPDFDVNLKTAIATARHAKDPLAELAYTWSVASDSGVFGTEMLYLNIHPMQQLLPKNALLRQYERVLCSAVAEVGVDVNTACSLDHIHGMLSFVPGLGPRKAANLKQNIVRAGGVVSSRRDLLAKRLMGPIVYNNAVAFLRIREVDQLSHQYLHPLDDTRLHPDVYHRNKWAVKIAIDALEKVENEGDKEEMDIKCLRDVMENSRDEVERLFNATKAEWERHFGPTFNIQAWDPRVDVPSDQWRDKVEELDLEAFAEMIERTGLGRWLSHLQMIKWEFRLPFEDPRKPMEPLSGDKLFKQLTGETDQSLRPGKEVTGKVVRNGDFGSRVKLEGDIPAFIPLRNLADEHVETAEDVVAVGTVITAVVTEVKKDHMVVDMSLRMEDFRKSPTSWPRPDSLPPLDEHFDRSAAVRIEQDKSKEREARLAALQLSIGGTKIGDDSQGGENGDGSKRRTGRVTRRACAHPAFRNAKNDEVDRELREAGDAMVGEALIRPSSKSSDSLAVHWVVRPGTIKVIEVLEEDKDTDASIGNVLKVKNETYGSIDELLGRYIASMNDYVEELMNHRKFLDLPEDEVDYKLREQKNANPKGVFYHLCWNEMHPGYASLRFIMSTTARNHPIGISPNGFLWGSKTYSNIDRLLNDFKKNPRGVSSSRTSAGTSRNQGATSVQEAKPSRWGAKPAAPPAPPAWGGRPPPMPPAAPPAQPAGWGAPSAPQGLPPPPQQQPPAPPSGPPPPYAAPQRMGYGQQPPPPPGAYPFQRPPPPGGPPPPGYPPRVQR